MNKEFSFQDMEQKNLVKPYPPDAFIAKPKTDPYFCYL